METNPVPRGPVGDPERAPPRYDYGDHHRVNNSDRDRRYQLTRTRSDEVTGGPSRKRAKHSRHDREPGHRAPRPRYLSETSHIPHRYRLGSGEERPLTFPAGPSPLNSSRFRRGETEKSSSGHRQMAICRPRKDQSAGTAAAPGIGGNPDKTSPRFRAQRPPPPPPPHPLPPPSHPSHPTQPATAIPSPQRTSSKEPRPSSGTAGSRYENNTYRSALAENFIRSVSGTYKMMNRAEERKRILSNQLPSCIKSKSIANSFIFCTPADGDHLETEIATTRKYQKRIVDFARLDTVIQNVSCRIRRRPMSATLTPRQTELIRAVRVISVAFNRITFVARIKHYCDRETRLANYLRDELTKRCSEGSRLNCGIRQFVGLVDLEHHRDLCLVFVGMLCQTPHMWARSIRLLSRLKIFYQNTLMKLFADEKMDLKDVFDLPYHSTAQKILSQVRQYTTSAFTLNDVVGGVVDAMRQRQSVPPLVFSSIPTRPPSSSSSAAAAAAAAAMAMAATMYDERYDPFMALDASQATKPEEHREYTFYPETGRRSKDRSSSDEDDREDDDNERNSPYNNRETDTDSSIRTSPGGRTPVLEDYDDVLKNDGSRYDDPFSSSSSPSIPTEIFQPLSPIPSPVPSPQNSKRTSSQRARSPTADVRSGGSSPSSRSSSSSSSPSSSSSSSSGTGSSASSHSSASEEPMTVSPYHTRKESVTDDQIANTDFTFLSPVHYLDQDQELPHNFISVHVGRSSPPNTRPQRECINIMLDSR